MNNKITEAFLLSAGLGTRMKELTKNIPKPMVELNGEPLISRNLKLLKKIGINKVYVNTHYKAELLEDYLGSGSKWGLEIKCIREEKLLDTGGGLANASKFFNTDNILLWNSDVFIDESFYKEDYNNLLEIYFKNKSLITLLVKELPEELKKSYSVLGINNNSLVTFLGESYIFQKDINKNQIEKDQKEVTFLGISVLSKKFIETIINFSREENKEIFSLTKDIFPKILSGALIGNTMPEISPISVSISNLYWNDVGNPKSLNEASKYLEDHFYSTTN